MIDPALLLAFIEQESSFKPNAFRNDRNGGSYGLMQLDYATAQDRGFNGSPIELYDPFLNVEYGVKVLNWLAQQLVEHGKFSLDNLAAAYNAGLTHVLNGGTDASYSESIKSAYLKWTTVLSADNIPPL